MQVIAFVILPPALMVFWISNCCDGIALCHTKCLDCNVNCEHGTYYDYCNRNVCRKSHGEQCGGPYDIGGKCGDGMTCNKCHRCTGCSLWTGVCEDHLCPN